MAIVTIAQIKEQVKTLIYLSEVDYGVRLTPNRVDIVSEEEKNTGFIFISFRKIKQWINQIDLVTPIKIPTSQEEQNKYNEVILIGNKQLIKEEEAYIFFSSITEKGWNIIANFVFAFVKTFI